MGQRAVLVNGRVTNIPSCQVSPGDTVTVKEKARKQVRVQAAVELAQQTGIPGWVEVDSTKFEGVYKRMPDRGELPAEINEHLIIELYSK